MTESVHTPQQTISVMAEMDESIKAMFTMCIYCVCLLCAEYYYITLS